MARGKERCTEVHERETRALGNNLFLVYCFAQGDST